jgi:hypothetical protein
VGPPLLQVSPLVLPAGFCCACPETSSRSRCTLISGRLVTTSYMRLCNYAYIYIYIYIYLHVHIVRPSRSVRPVAVVVFCPSVVRPSVRSSVRPVVRSVVVVLCRSVRPVVSVPSCPSRHPLSVRPCSSRRPLSVRPCPSRRRRASSVRPSGRCRRASSVRPSRRRRRASSVRPSRRRRRASSVRPSRRCRSASSVLRRPSVGRKLMLPIHRHNITRVRRRWQGSAKSVSPDKRIIVPLVTFFVLCDFRKSCLVEK